MTGSLFIFVYEKKRNSTIYELFMKKRFEIIRIIDYIYITLIITWTKYRFKHPWRMEFSQVSNKESVENRSKACAKPKGLNFIFNKYFRFPDLRFKNYLLQWLFISQGSERKDVDQWWGKFNSPSYFDKLLR